ncbi:VPLPA-CTERM protein sorting domain-containing protein [Syntrophus gentianae]|uniref:VPLPA-CTERM protein sorting domain-containing protein n=1 Tax=Syntrophus gentianae TaxID=43775 RepID=A0A1H7VLY0_9BACT|nr:VPLPA-CTERM sorting domain-containing protein [Syntrophus gentianae]SEM09807.1 VPLPA-CTERM protein sorting domain-containing protein [Syntrophus gentianae]
MVKRAMMITAVTAILILVAQMASAYTITTGSSFGPYQSGQGGEFTLQADNALQSILSGYISGTTADIKQQNPLSSETQQGTFQSFCLEKDEYLYTGATYAVTISNSANGGGKNTNSGDPISLGTAYLYSNFAKGTLSGYNYSYESQRETSAAALQHAIWYLENEETYADAGGTSNIFLNAVISQFGSLENADDDSNGAYGIKVANLWVPGHEGDLAYARQDQLVATPIPAAAWLLASGLVGLIAVRRRNVN